MRYKDLEFFAVLLTHAERPAQQAQADGKLENELKAGVP